MGDSFEVATLGAGRRDPLLPFPQFQWHPNDFYLPLELPMIARDWANGEPLILFTIHDIQRMLPLADPTFCPDDNLAEWIKRNRREGKLKLWGYFPVDAHNKDGKLGPQLMHTLTHYDRVLVPSKWAKGIIEKTLPSIEVEAIPHGIDPEIFKPLDKQQCRENIGQVMSAALEWPKREINIPKDALWVGIVATNQSRKDWGLGVEVVAELAKTRPVFLWAHTDRLKSDYGWSIYELLSDFGLLESSMITMGNVSDPAMAVGYSACDLTLGIGRGEGFGYCVAESLFCGTPCFSYMYGAQEDYLPSMQLIPSFTSRIEGPLNLLRPIGNVKDWVEVINRNLERRWTTPNELAWPILWPSFAIWFRKGI